VSAGRCMSMLIDAVPNSELRNGYHIQFLDEVRHTGMQTALARWYAKNVPDPEGWNMGPQGVARDPVLAPGLNMLSQFMVGDPIQCAFTPGLARLMCRSCYADLASRHHLVT